METFLEILITAVFTFFAGFLCLRYKPKTRKRTSQVRSRQPVRSTHMRMVYRKYAAKFVVVILFGLMFFSGIFYLAERGYIIIKW